MSEAKQDNKSSQTKVTPVYKKWWFWVIIVVLILIVGGAASSNSNNGPKKVGESSESNDSTKTESSAPDNKSDFKVGDVISMDGLEIVVTSVERNWKSSNEYEEPKDGKEYVKVNIKIENKSSDKKSYNATNWEIEDSDGAIEGQAFVIGNDDDLSYGDLASGGKKSGLVIFEVPAEDKGLKIHYQPNMFIDDNEAIIVL